MSCEDAIERRNHSQVWRTTWESDCETCIKNRVQLCIRSNACLLFTYFYSYSHQRTVYWHVQEQLNSFRLFLQFMLIKPNSNCNSAPLQNVLMQLNLPFLPANLHQMKSWNFLLWEIFLNKNPQTSSSSLSNESTFVRAVEAVEAVYWKLWYCNNSAIR